MYMLEMSIIYLTYLCILEFVWKDTYHSMVHVAYIVRTGLYFIASLKWGEKYIIMYPLFRDVAGPYQRALWVKYVLYTHIIAFIIKSNWKLSQNLHTWTTQYVHFQCGIYWPKPVVLASSSTSISSKWNILSEFFIFYTKASTSALATILCPIMCGSKWPIFKVCK